MAGAGEQVRIAIEGVADDGVDLTPTTVPAAEMLELAAAYLDLIRRLIDEGGVEVEFRGLRVTAGSMVLAVETDKPELVALAQRDVMPLVHGAEHRSRLKTAVVRLADALRALPPHSRAYTQIGDQTWNLVRPAEQPAGVRVSRTTIRATPLRIGGVSPVVRFKSESEPYNFTLQVTQDEAREIGALLYREIDLHAELHRDDDGLIRSGRVLDFAALDEREAGEAWREWYRRCLAEWDRVPDVDARLRGDPGERRER